MYTIFLSNFIKFQSNVQRDLMVLSWNYKVTESFHMVYRLH